MKYERGDNYLLFKNPQFRCASKKIICIQYAYKTPCLLRVSQKQ